MLKSFRQSQLSFRPKCKKEEARKVFYCIFSENVDLDTQKSAVKNMLFFSGKSQFVFVLRRKKTANFLLVLKEASLFEVLPLTQSNHNKLRFRSVFSATNLERFRSMSENSGIKKYFFKNLFSLKMLVGSRIMLLGKLARKFLVKGCKIFYQKLGIDKLSWCFQR